MDYTNAAPKTERNPMNQMQKTGVAGGTAVGAGFIVWLGSLFGYTIPPEAATGIGALLGYVVREIHD